MYNEIKFNKAFHFFLVASLFIFNTTITTAKDNKISIANIEVTQATLDFGEVFKSSSVTLKNTIFNSGTESLSIGSLKSDNPYFKPYYANGDTSGDFQLNPGDSVDVFVLFTTESLGIQTDTITIKNSGAEITFSVTAESVNAPVAEITPDSLSESVNSGDVLNRNLSISNIGSSELEYSLSIQSGQQAKLISSSPEFSGVGELKLIKRPPTLRKERSFQTSDETYSQSIESPLRVISKVSETSGFASPKIEDLLASTDENLQSVADMIQGRFDFSGGTDFDEIYDGGNDMYDGGNRLFYNNDFFLPYSNLQVDNSSFSTLGIEYFTAKKNGIFTFVGDFNSITSFGINGNLGADGGGSMKGNVFEIMVSGKTFQVFTKQVYGAGDPSVNHIIMVENGGNLEQNFSTYTGDEFHEVRNFDSSARVFYLLFAGKDGKEFTMQEMETVAKSYLEIFNFSPPYISIPEDFLSGSVSSGSQLNIPLIFNAEGLLDSTYYAEFLITTNDPDLPSKIIPVELKVHGAPGIQTDRDTLNFGNIFVGDTTTVDVTFGNGGTDNLEISNAIFSNNAFEFTNPPNFPFNISPGQEIEKTVRFNPPNVQNANSTLTLFSNDPNDPEFIVTITAAGVEPPIAGVNPSDFSFDLNSGDFVAGSFQLSNSGGSELNYQLSNRNKKSLDDDINDFFSEHVYFASSGYDESKGEDLSRILAYSLTSKEVTDTLFSQSAYNSSIRDIAYHENKIFFVNPDNIYSISVLDINSGLVTDSVVLNTFDFEMIRLTHSGEYLYSSAHNNQDDNYYLIEIDPKTGEVTDTLFSEAHVELAPTYNGSENLIYFTYGTQIRAYDLENDELLEPVFEDNDMLFWNLSYSFSRNSIIAYAIHHDKFDEGVFEIDLETQEVHFYGHETTFLGDESNRRFLNGIATDEAGFKRFLSFTSPESGTVDAGHSETVEFSISTAGMYGGDYLSEIEIESNDPEKSSLTIPVNLAVTGVPAIGINPDSLHFGNLFVGTQARQLITIKNTGTQDLEITAISSSINQFSISEEDLPITLPPFSSKEIEITFSPTGPAALSGEIMVLSNASSSPEKIIRVSGNGVEPPVLSLGAESLEYTLDYGDSLRSNFHLSNTGGSDLIYDLRFELEKDGDISNGYDKNTLFISSSDTDENGGDEFPMVIAYSLQDKKIIDTVFVDRVEISAYENIAYNQGKLYLQHPDGFTRIQVFDVNQKKIIKEVDFGGSMYIFSLTHSGNALYGNFNDRNGQYHVIEIDVENERLADTLYSTSNNSAVPVAINETASELYGEVDGNIVVYDKETGLKLREISVTENLGYFRMSYSKAHNSIFLYGENEDTFTYQSYELDLETETLMQTSFPDLGYQVWDFAFDGDPSSGLFSFISSSPDTIGVSQGKQIEFLIDAKDTFGDFYPGNVVITTNNPQNPETLLPIDITVVAEPILEIDPDTIDFGAKVISGTYTHPITLTNSGYGVATVSDISIDNDVFSISNPDSTLEIRPLTSKKINVTFTAPDTVSVQNGTLTLISNGFGVGSKSIYLKAESIIGPKIEVSYDKEEIEVLQGDTTSIAILVTNSGDSELRFHLDYSNDSGIENKDTEAQKTAADANQILLIQDEWAWNIDPENVVSDLFGNTYSTINSDDIATTNFDDFDIIVTSGGQNRIYYSNISLRVDQFEEYLNNGGLVLYSVATFDRSVVLAGDVEATYDHEFHADIYNSAHPLMKSLTSNSFSSIGTHQAFYNLPDQTDTVVVARESRLPAFVEYKYGSGQVIATGIPLEYVHNRSSVIFEMQDFYSKVLVYAHELAEKPNWIRLPEKEIVLDSDEEKSVRVVLDSNELLAGTYEAQILAHTNIAGESSTQTIANIVLHVNKSVSNETGIEIPTEPELSQNYPNPFNPTTSIKYGLPESGNVEIKIYNILGQTVMTLVNGYKQAGRYAAVFDARQLSSGAYFYQFSINNKEVETKRMMLIK